MKLTAAQVQEYHDRGVVMVPNVLTDADLAPVIEAIDRWVDQRAATMKADGRIEDTGEGLGFTKRLSRLHQQNSGAAGSLDIMQSRLPEIFQFLYNEHLLDAVESLVGPEVLCNPIQHLRAKFPAEVAGGSSEGYSQNVPWHQDAAVTWEEADPSEIVTCWLPLVDATKETGCMKIFPGVHRQGYLEHLKEGGTTVRPDLLPTDEPMVAECPRGGVIFMNKYTPHAGLTNHSDIIRWSLDLRYQAVGTPTGRPFWPAFVVRSRQNPEAAVPDYDAWCRRWDEALAKSKGIAWHRTVPREQRMPAGA